MVKRSILHGKPVIVLEELQNAIVYVEEEKFGALCEDIFDDVKNNPAHPLRGKTLKRAINDDTDDRMGYGKYKNDLKKLGVI